jgi:hypothetical protein
MLARVVLARAQDQARRQGFVVQAVPVPPGVADWRNRVGGDDAKTIYKKRAATAECANAQARNRGLTQFLVRSVDKVKTIALPVRLEPRSRPAERRDRRALELEIIEVLGERQLGDGGLVLDRARLWRAIASFLKGVSKEECKAYPANSAHT